MRTIVDTVPTALLVLLVVGGVVLLLLQFPFSGGLAVEPTPFRERALAPLLAGPK